jgi:hypothetical protein
MSPAMTNRNPISVSTAGEFVLPNDLEQQLTCLARRGKSKEFAKDVSLRCSLDLYISPCKSTPLYGGDLSRNSVNSLVFIANNIKNTL